MGFEEIVAKYNNYIEITSQQSYALFYAYGRWVSQHRGWIIPIGLLITIFFIAGVYRFEWVKDMDKIWVEQGTRIIPERDFFNDNFGGVPRVQQFIIVDSSSENNVISEEHFNALLDVSNRMSNPNYPGGLYMTRNSTNYTEISFCDTPAMNPLLSNPNSILYIGLRNAINVYNTACSKDPSCSDDELIPQIPAGFYVSRLPCFRFTVLDCFSEGAYDYPQDLNYLSNIARKLLYSPYSTATPPNIDRLIFPGYDSKPSYHDIPDLFGYLSEQFNKQQQDLPNNCTQWNGVNVAIELILGDLDYDGDTIARAGITRLVHNNLHWDALNFIERFPYEDDREDFVLDFEKELIDYFKPYWKRDPGTGFADGEIYDGSEFYFLSARSTQDMVREGATPPFGFIAIGYLLLLIYASSSLAKTTRPCSDSNKVYSRTGLAFFGVILVLLGTLGGVGLAAWFGVRFNFIVTNVVPFLSLGLGIDDMFVLAHTLPANSRDPPDRRIALALGLSGPSVTLTSLANFCAFLISASVPIPAIQGFCYVMACCVLIIWGVLITMFVAMMAIDTRRIQSSKMDCCFCVSIPETKPISKLSHINSFMANFFAPAILSKAGEIIVILISLIFFAITIWGLTLVKPGLLPTDIAVVGSYQEQYQSISYGKMEAAGQFLVTKYDIDFPNQYQYVIDSLADLQKSSWIADTIPLVDINWLIKFQNYYNFTHPGSDGVIPPETWYKEFLTWITSAGYASRNDVICLVPGKTIDDDDNRIYCTDSSVNITNVKIYATKTIMVFKNLDTEEKIMDAIKDVREIIDGYADDYDIDEYMYGPLFLYWEQYFHIFDIAFETIGFTLLAVFIATFIFQLSPLCSIILCVVIFIIDIEIFGLMGFTGIKLNAISVVNLSMSVGLSVEFTAHLSRSFLIHSGTNKDRIITSLQELGTPIINGAVSSFLGIATLGVAEYPFFKTFYFTMYSYMILIAFLNGFVLLPVLLRIFGPKAFSYHDRKSEDGFDLDVIGTNQVLGENGENGENGEKL